MAREVDDRRKSRSAGLTHTSIALALFVSMAVLAATPARQDPPSIAEFAPQPREQITQAPPEQTSDFGSGEGGEATGDPAAAPSESEAPPSEQPSEPEPSEEAPIERARVRRCVGDPPRQIEDPQSPPCVPFFDGDNGGETSRGVTATTVRIAVPYDEGSGTELDPLTIAWQNFFNARFEFYGRKLELVPVQTRDGVSGADVNPAEQKAHAEAVEAANVFASLGYPSQMGGEYYFHDELARRGIVNIYSIYGTMRSQEQLQAQHPYTWGVMPTLGDITRDLGAWICAYFNEGPAQHAGLQYQAVERKWGILLAVPSDGSAPDYSALRKQFESCGIPAPFEQRIPYESAADATQSALLNFRDQGVTSVIVLTDFFTLALNVYPTADQLGYEPEWLVNSWLAQEDPIIPLFGPTSGRQQSHSFGLRSRDKEYTLADWPCDWALKEINPELICRGALNTFIYEPLLVLASGIQGAGPNLTPETFGQALFDMDFPNPNAGAPPYWQSRIGFGPGDHTFYDDATQIWFSPTTRPHEYPELVGAYCYVDRGARYTYDAFPSAKPELYSGSCY